MVTQTGLNSHCWGLHAAWVIYDGDQKRVLAARDASGSADMHWGTTGDGRFMFGSDPIDLTECNPTATPFPAGDVAQFSLPDHSHPNSNLAIIARLSTYAALQSFVALPWVAEGLWVACRDAVCKRG